MWRPSSIYVCVVEVRLADRPQLTPADVEKLEQMERNKQAEE